MREEEVIEGDQRETTRKLFWFIDSFLYPVNVSGLFNIAIFWFGPYLINLLGKYALWWAMPYGALIILWFHILLVGYLFHYISECIRDSAGGANRAVDISLEVTPNKGELVMHLIYIFACVSVSFCAAGIYHLVTQRADWIFWLLLALGVFFFPMLLLANVMFDSLEALNPVLIIASIFSTFFHYCGVVLAFCVPIGIVVVILVFLPGTTGRATSFILHGVCIYLLLVASNLLGRFFHRNEERLYWEV